MPLWPFILLVSIFVAVLIVPPLVAAYIDYLAESRREAVQADKERRVEAGANDEVRNHG